MITTPSIDITAAVSRPGTGQRIMPMHRIAARPWTAAPNPTVAAMPRWYTTGGASGSDTCTTGFVHLVSGDGAKRLDPGHLGVDLT